MILGATDQKLWVFEVFRRSLGRAGMCWSQPARIDPNRGGQEEKKFGKKGYSVRRAKCRLTAGGRPLVAGQPWSATSGRRKAGD
jgi:hypothetical protein